VSVAAIGQTIRIATLGDLPQNAAKFSLAERQVPIRVSLLESSRSDLATLENLPVRTAAGGTVPLKSVAEISFGRGPSTIRRYNQSRRIIIESDLNGVEIGPELAKVKSLPELAELPDGVRLVEVGQAEFIKELFGNFALAIGAGVGDALHRATIAVVTGEKRAASDFFWGGAGIFSDAKQRYGLGDDRRGIEENKERNEFAIYERVGRGEQRIEQGSDAGAGGSVGFTHADKRELPGAEQRQAKLGGLFCVI
jgi:hypothetical protein